MKVVVANCFNPNFQRQMSAHKRIELLILSVDVANGDSFDSDWKLRCTSSANSKLHGVYIYLTAN